ncbi:transcriptional regulator, LysR family [Granulicella rosea]|uniref:Transcriptional regulator, LysR family n=1 Tax=Granulicella rosea TaxID=474952 RepID=A0A239EAC4_9BACT|nr:LysR family transcriptional regulator [Granulicella rosea]SNS41411.1 transcriptional regulator, LysR family [Granulicella rosea]
MARSEIKLMEAAIALGEELSFARAAYRLGITQPTLTKQIAELESRLGAILFARNHRTVILSEIGQAFLKEARLSVLHADRALQAVRTAKEDVEAVLNVGRSPHMDPFLVSTLLEMRMTKYPKLRIELHTRLVHELVRDVETGVLDLAFLTEPPEAPLLTKIKVAEAPFYIAILGTDRLVAYPALRMKQLAQRQWVLFERQTHPMLYERLLTLAIEQNAAPRGVHHFMAVEEAYALLEENESVVLLTKADALTIARTGVAVRPLEEAALCIKTYLASRSDNHSKLVSSVVRALIRKLETVQFTSMSLLLCATSPVVGVIPAQEKYPAR